MLLKADICMFKDVGDFYDFVSVICEGGPFLLSVLSLWVLYCVFLFNIVMRWTGNLLFLPMARIFCHSVSFLSVVRGSDVILLGSGRRPFCVRWGDWKCS